ncbi:HPr family phosphocarrier protein [Alkalihalobacterium bogoriense]|uniref:HPr family phosphocarrier protein n=1 Tax=Alkalihalobacterium bogoriense TaxID=246272 RepID=UPI00047B6268|nr:HPr family phosphocarrier protein [Alkalihalobacterium bogoriense]
MNLTVDGHLRSKLNHQRILQLVTKANQFNSYILIQFDTKTLNAKSLLSACALHGVSGPIRLQVHGDDSNQALHVLTSTLFEQ